MVFLARISIFSFLILLASEWNVYGQSIEISVKDKRSPLPGATVMLKSLADTTAIYRTTGEKGVAEFTKVKDGPYSLKVSYIGYETQEKTITVRLDRRRFDVYMKESTVTLGEATVAAKKPLIRQEDDKMIIDPEPIASISTNTLEVLESTPGLYVDQDGGIYLNSATPAVVYINGREQKMSQQDVMSLLRSLPPGSVEKIEILRTPSTRYDASSSGGIVNVVLKKGVKLGRFGTANAGMNQGKYGNRYAGVNFNNSGEKSTYYINTNYNRNDQQENLNSIRYFEGDTALSQSSLSRQTSDQVYVGYGISYDIRDNLTFSYDGRVNTSFQNNNSGNGNVFSAGNDAILSESNNDIHNDIDFVSIQQDFGLVKKIDTADSQWDNKFSYSYNRNYTYQDYSTTYLSPMHYTLSGEGDNLQERHYVIGSSDLTYAFSKNLKMETGIKSSFQYFLSDAEFVTLVGGIAFPDSSRISGYSHIENINAAYAQISKTFFESLVLKTGVRMEHTYMKGIQTIPSRSEFLINRVDFFPYIYLSRTIIKMFDIELRAFLIYRRTIMRPGYQQLNPSVKFNDQFLYEVGNPELKPQFTDNIEANLSYEEWPVFAIGQNYTTDIFSNVVYRDPVNPAISVMTYDNLGKNKETYFRGMAGIPPGRTYFFGLGAQYNLTEYDGFYENEPLTFTRGSWRFFTFHSLRITKSTKFYFSGFMMQNGLFNFYELNTFGQVNAGLRQSFLDDRLNITLQARDIFRTMVTEFELNQGSQRSSGNRYTDTQHFGINIRYTFGLSAKEDKRNPTQFENED